MSACGCWRCYVAQSLVRLCGRPSSGCQARYVKLQIESLLQLVYLQGLTQFFCLKSMRTDRSHVLFHNTCKASSEGVNKSTCGLFCEGKSLNGPSILYVKARFWWCTATRIGLCWTLTGMKSQARKTDISELAVTEVEGRLLHHLKHALERTTKITRSQGVYTFCTWGNSSPYQQVVVVQIFIICLLSSLSFLLSALRVISGNMSPQLARAVGAGRICSCSQPGIGRWSSVRLVCLQ